MPKAAELFAAHAAVAQACLEHPFVRGIASGELDRDAFVFFVGQDAAFLDGFVRAYALGLARAPDRDAMDDFKSLLDGALDELRLHRTYAERWDVPLHVEPAPATTAYTDFLLRVAALEPVAHLCAAMAPCMRLYAWLGQRLAPVASDTSPYLEWVQTYADPGFEQLAVTLEAMLDRLPGDEHTITAHYRTAMRLELAFFDAALVAGVE